MNFKIYNRFNLVKVFVLFAFLTQCIFASGQVHNSTSSTNPNCWGTGTAYSAASAGTAPYTFKWFTILGVQVTTGITSTSSTSSIAGLAGGSYYSLIIDATGAKDSVVFSINPPPQIIVDYVTKDILCKGASNGAITIVATGGTGTLSGTGLKSGLAAGNYTYTISDANGCSAVTTISISDPLQLSLTATGTDVTCNGNNDGTASVSVSGGTTSCATSAVTFENGLLSPRWSSIGTAEVDGDYGNVSPTEGSYQGLVTTSGSNFDSTDIENFARLTPGSLAATLGNYLTNGSAIKRTVTVNAGDTLKIDWNYMSTDYVPFLDPSFLSITGNGVHYLADVSTINQNWLGSNTYGFIYENGYQTFSYIFTTGGTYTVAVGVFNMYDQLNDAGVLIDKFRINTECTSSGYTYVWNTNPVQSTQTATGLSPGTYTVTVTDQNGCTATSSVSISQPVALSASTSITTPVQCNSGTAVVNVTASGGTVPYTGTGSYSVTAGVSTFTVTDSKGCSSTTTLTVTEPSLLIVSSSATSIACNGGTAVVSVTATGGTTTYSGTGSYTVTAGIYSYTVTDVNGCSSSTTITITEPTALSVSSSATNISCNGGTAVVSVTATGGATSYTGVSSYTVVAGTYTYTVTDANGCASTTTITVSQPDALNASSAIVTPISSSGGTAVISVTATGGTLPYTGTGTFTVTAGTYTYTVTDVNGCSKSTTITIGQPTTFTPLTIGITITTPIKCHGGTGVVTVTCAGGVPGYSCNGRSGTSNTFTYTVVAGTYTYTVTDNSSNTTSTTITVSQPSSLIATSTVTTPITCYGGTGVVTVTLGGGASTHYYGCGHTYTVNTYTYRYTVTAGTYTFTVADHNGCTATTTITVTQPATVIATSSVTTPIACYGGTAVVTVTFTGGVSHYSGCGHYYSQNYYSGDYSSRNYYSGNSYTYNVKAGIYTFTVTDHNGRTATTTITVTQPSALTANSIATSPTCWGRTGSITVTATGGTPNYLYSINSGGTCGSASWTSNNVIGGLAAGIYNVTVKDANGCTVSAGRDTIKTLQSCSASTTFCSTKWHTGCNSTGSWLSSHWSSTYGNCIVLGNYSCGKGIKFTSVGAVQNFLTNGTGTSCLTTNYCNPSGSGLNNGLACQLLTITLNVGYSPAFGNLIIGTGVFAGKTVNQLITIAHQALAGVSTGYTNSSILACLNTLNLNYENNGNNGNLFNNCSLTKSESSPFVQGSDNSTVINENDLTLFPNPSSSTVTISFTLNNDSEAKIEIYNIAGQLVSTLFNDKAMNNAKYVLTMEGSEMSPGMYFCKLTAGDQSLVKKVMIVK